MSRSSTFLRFAVLLGAAVVVAAVTLTENRAAPARDSAPHADRSGSVAKSSPERREAAVKVAALQAKPAAASTRQIAPTPVSPSGRPLQVVPDGFDPVAAPILGDATGLSGMRVHLDPDGAWRMPTPEEDSTLGVLGVELPSDETIEVVLPDGTGIIYLGRRGQEYLVGQVGPDRRLYVRCAPDPAFPAADHVPAAVEK